MPGANPILEKLWDFGRSNPQILADLVRLAKERFGSTTEPPTPPPPPRSSPAVDRLEDLESNVTSLGHMMGRLEAGLSELEARHNALELRAGRAETDAANCGQAVARISRKLRTAVIALTASLAAAFGLIFYLLASR